MKNKELFLSAMSDVREDYLAEAAAYTARKRRPRVSRVLIAAVAAAAMAITVGAVGLSLHQSARDSIGVTDPQRVSGYTEYELRQTEAPAPTEDAVIEGRMRGGPIQLVSALCSEGHMTAFVSVPGITAEMAGAADEASIWNGDTDPAVSLGFEHVSYDADSRTALVRVNLFEVPQNAKSVTLNLMYQCQLPDTPWILYDPLEIPVTESAGLHAAINRTVTHPNMDDFMVQILDLNVYADHLSVALEVPRYEDFMASLGDDAASILAKLTGSPTAAGWEQSQYYVWMSMLMNSCEGIPDSPDYIMSGLTLNLKDGSQLSVAGLDRQLAAEWTVAETGYDTGLWRFECVLTKTLDLDEIESVTLDGVTYPLAQ